MNTPASLRAELIDIVGIAIKLRARWGWSLSNLVALLRQQLFVHRELFAWLDEPFHLPPGSEPEPQQQLLLAGMEA